MNKIFGIGISRTGTSSLAGALVGLGFEGVHCANERHYLNFLAGNYYRFGTDLPFYLRFKELDEVFPNSKFILTIRPNVEEWLESMRHVHLELPVAEYVINYRIERCGTAEFDSVKLLEFYHKHHKEVFDYFKNRMEDLLVYNLIGGDGWRPLCKFLNRPIPKISFPHYNKRTEEVKVP